MSNETPDIEESGAPAGEGEAAVVLAAVDTSPSASRVIDLATRIVRRTWHGASLHVVHAFRWQPFDRSSRAGIPVDELAAEARQYLDYEVRVASRQCGRPVTGHFVEGHAEEAIIELARSIGADLVVVGGGEPGGIKALLRGSVAEQLAKRAPCPVLIVRPKERAYVKIGREE